MKSFQDRTPRFCETRDKDWLSRWITFFVSYFPSSIEPSIEFVRSKTTSDCLPPSKNSINLVALIIFRPLQVSLNNTPSTINFSHSYVIDDHLRIAVRQNFFSVSYRPTHSNRNGSKFREITISTSTKEISPSDSFLLFYYLIEKDPPARGRVAHTRGRLRKT